jgi:hypothetical protein
MTIIAPGKTYSPRHGVLTAPGGTISLQIPAGYNGRLGKESLFKIISNDGKVSCFMRFHDAASPLARGWIGEAFNLDSARMKAVGPAQTMDGIHCCRFEGDAYVAYKFEKFDAGRNGISASVATTSDQEDDLKHFMVFVIRWLQLGRKAAPQPAPAPVPPAPVAAPARKLDRALVGMWHWSEFISSGSASITSHRYRLLSGDGQFVQSSRSFATSVRRDSSGNWMGMDLMKSAAAPGDRGWWEIKSGKLILHYEDDTYTDFDYFLRGDDLMLTDSRGRRTLWSRE